MCDGTAITFGRSGERWPEGSMLIKELALLNAAVVCASYACVSTAPSQHSQHVSASGIHSSQQAERPMSPHRCRMTFCMTRR